MNWADIAVCAGGTTSLEVLYMQLPSITLTLADNQTGVVDALEKQGLSSSLGWYKELTSKKIADAIENLILNDREEQLNKMAKLDIGKGKTRVVKAIKQLLFHNCQLRPATINDLMDLFHLSNERAVRENSLTPEEIMLSNHEEWFQKKLNDEQCVFYIVKDANNQFLGQVRFDRNKNKDYTISIGLGKQLRGSGLGSAIIAKATEQLCCDRQVNKIIAIVKPSNIASIKSFEKAQYQQKIEEKIERQTESDRNLELVFQR